MFSRILVPVDIPEPELTGPALAQAAELAKASGAAMHLVYVRPFMIDAALEHLPRDFFAHEERQALEELRRLAQITGLPQGKVSTASPIGNVYDHVVAAGKAFNADLIVIGSRRPAMSTYLLGSNAARIVRHAECSVLVVR
jgi:nucleotide-binding universal stress UspA family protein